MQQSILNHPEYALSTGHTLGGFQVFFDTVHLNSVTSPVEKIVKNWNSPDLEYWEAHENANPHTAQLVRNLRTSPAKKFSFVVYDGMQELEATAANPDKIVKPNEATVFNGYGPQPDIERTSSKLRFWHRWVGILFSLFAWLGIGIWLTKLKFELRIILGFLISGFITLIASWVFSVPIEKIAHPLGIALATSGVAGLFYQLLKKNIRLNFLPATTFEKIIFVFLVFRALDRFLFSAVEGWDARVVWLYRAKFAFIHGFSPSFIAQNFPEWAHPDYSWILGGALSFASVPFGKLGYAGWHENAAYGSYLWLYLALLFGTYRFLIEKMPKVSPMPPLLRISIFFLAFIALDWSAFAGYMDFLWALPTAIFLSEWIRKRNELNLWANISPASYIFLCFGVAIKNEAIAIFALVLISALWWGLKTKQLFRKRSFDKSLFQFIILAIPTLFFKFALELAKVPGQYGLIDRFKFTDLGEVGRRFESIIRYLMKNVFFGHPNYKYVFLITALGAIGFFGVKNEARKILLWIAYLGIPSVLIYIYTPFNLDWHLATSANRVFLFAPSLIALYLGSSQSGTMAVPFPTFSFYLTQMSRHAKR